MLSKLFSMLLSLFFFAIFTPELMALGSYPPPQDPSPPTPPNPTPTPDPTPEPTPPSPTPTPPRDGQRVESFRFIDEESNVVLAEITEGKVVDLAPFKNRIINIEAVTSPQQVGSVRVRYNNLDSRKENVFPYTVFRTGDGRNDIVNGETTLFAEPFSARDLGGRRGESLEVSFTVKGVSDEAPPPSPPSPPPGPPPGRTKNVTSTIVITKPGTYDFEGVMHVWKGSGSCIQKENQPPILKISASNVTVKNFYWRGAPDGIHVHCNVSGQGNTCKQVIRNVKLVNFRGHACEDLLTTGPVENLVIEGGEFSENPNARERDKTFQLNFGNPIIIRGAKFIGGKRCIRSKGGAFRVEVHDSIFEGCEYPFRGDTARDISGIPHGREIRFISRNNVYRNCNRAFSRVDSKVKVESSGDRFENCRRD